MRTSCLRRIRSTRRSRPTPYPYNLSKAKQLVQQSGTAGQTVGVYTISDDAIDKAQGEYLAGQLDKIGWKTQLHELAGANYFVIIGNQATKAQIMWTDWFEDYPYPTDWFQVLQYGPNITQQHNNNNSNVNFKDTNNTINQLGHLRSVEGLLAEHDERLGGARQQAHGQVREPRLRS